MKRTRLNKYSSHSAAQAKREIQALLRELVIKRDGGCVLRKLRHCNDPVLQADHLITRANSATYADYRLVVCLCRSCHGWKHFRKEEYDSILRGILPKDRVELWEKCLRESWRPVKMDWQKEAMFIRQEIKKL